MRTISAAAVLASLVAGVAQTAHVGTSASSRVVALPAGPVAQWSREAQRAIVPAGPEGVFGRENAGTKFPGEAAVYMGIVHVAIYDAAVAVGGGYRPYATALAARDAASPAAAIATAAHHVLVGLQPALGLSSAHQLALDERYRAYLAGIQDQAALTNGVAIGERVAAAVLARRAGDGRDRNPQVADLRPPVPGPGVWDAGSEPALGLRLPGIRPLALESGRQFRPPAPPPLASAAYADDFREVASLGRADSAARSAEQTTQALFWTDHDVRQWNEGLLALAAARDLDLVRTARMLALAHVAGGDAMIACFDAKYAYWYWRPFQAIPRAAGDGNPATAGDAAWRPLRATPNFPEYPSAHACHSGAVSEALQAFFGTADIPFSLESRVTGTSRRYDRLPDVVDDVNDARVVVGFHFRSSDRVGAELGRTVGRYVATHLFLPRDE